MSVAPVVALEIGTSKVLALVAEMREDGCVMITGIGEEPSAGIRKGEVVDLENAITCTRSVLAMAEESGKVAIRQVHLAASGGHISSLMNRGTVPVLDKDGEITRDDIDQVMEVARAVNLPVDREILHTICQQFCIDDQEQVIKPEGMEGAKLSLDMLVLHGIRNRLNNTIKVVSSLSVDVQDVVFSGLCSALAVLSAEQKQSGAVVIDLGGGTTNYLAYTKGVVADAGVLGVGGDHITNDIALAFNIPMLQAEDVKRESGCAVVKTAVGPARIALPAEVGFPGCTVSVKSLHKVINARVEEMIDVIRRRLEVSGILHHIGAGVVLTGGGAHLKEIVTLVEDVFSLPCSIGRPRNVSGLAVATEGPEYATCCGLAQYGFKMQDKRRSGVSLGGWFKGIFRR